MAQVIIYYRTVRAIGKNLWWHFKQCNNVFSKLAVLVVIHSIPSQLILLLYVMILPCLTWQYLVEYLLCKWAFMDGWGIKSLEFFWLHKFDIWSVLDFCDMYSSWFTFNIVSVLTFKKWRKYYIKYMYLWSVCIQGTLLCNFQSIKSNNNSRQNLLKSPNLSPLLFFSILSYILRQGSDSLSPLPGVT